MKKITYISCHIYPSIFLEKPNTRNICKRVSIGKEERKGVKKRGLHTGSENRRINQVKKILVEHIKEVSTTKITTFPGAHLHNICSKHNRKWHSILHMVMGCTHYAC
jgi:hypothetical protein